MTLRFSFIFTLEEFAREMLFLLDTVIEVHPVKLLESSLMCDRSRLWSRFQLGANYGRFGRQEQGKGGIDSNTYISSLVSAAVDVHHRH